MGILRVGPVLFVGMMIGGAALATMRAQQPTARATFQSLEIVLPVTDVNRSVEFYRTILEFEPANVLPTVRGFGLNAKANNLPAPGPDTAVLTVGGHTLVLRVGLKEAVTVDGMLLRVQVANTREYADRLRARGVPVTVEFTDMNRQPAFTISDPDGHRFHFHGAIDAALLRPPGGR